KLVYDAVQEMRIAHIWDAIEQENKEIELSRECKKTFILHKLENGDTEKQLLARSRYLLFKGEDKWTVSQTHWAEILFRRYPDLEKAYKLSRPLARIYQTSKLKDAPSPSWLIGTMKWKKQTSNHSIRCTEPYRITTLPF